MYKVFTTIEELYQEIETDKNWTGAESAVRNRYPIRFVLFENFHDFYEFTDECANHNVVVQGMDKWMKDGVDDSLLTYSQLGKRFREYIDKVPANDLVIAPFSEIARFYDNSAKNAEFDSLVKTIRLIESQEEAQKQHQRIYVPIIGMQNKMDRFKDDTNIHIWEYRSSTESRSYRLILTPGTSYGVCGLEEEYTICKNVKSWIALWRKGKEVKKQIICTSRSLYNNAEHAQPDNAFDYTVCNSAYDFLGKGLGLDFGELQEAPGESTYWEELAKHVDINDFEFNTYIKERFNIVSLDGAQEFLQVWQGTSDEYSRWLLKTYYIFIHKDDTYLKRVLTKCHSLTSSELFSNIATQIFEEYQNGAALSERSLALCEGARLGVKITEMAERDVLAKLTSMATDPVGGYNTAMKYLSPISQGEKLLMVEWLGKNYITRNSIEKMYPELFQYTAPFAMPLAESKMWVNDYFTEYCKSKISNDVTQELQSMLSEKNASPITFESWRDGFKTVKTALYGREDIDIFYWIDGMGVDWIPFICSIIQEHEVDNVYLNEILIATAELPTRTENNRVKLEELCGNKLQKAGDIDHYAHQQKKYPAYIDEEFMQMKKIISSVLNHYNGKKIAFVSDHGISYLACHETGMNIANIKGDHAGRCGEWNSGVPSKDSNYIILEDGKSICSLTHHSLTTKVPEGQGAHGGATPEEVLVPIIIVSNHKNATNFSAQLHNNEISASSPVVTYTIKGLSSIDVPVVIYNGVEYILKKKSDSSYESERLNLVDTATAITLKIGQFKQQDILNINTGIDEDNLFDDLF